MTLCSVPLCGNCSEYGFTVFGLPKNIESREKWLLFLEKCGKQVDTQMFYRICEQHFGSSDVLQGVSRKTLKPGAFPVFIKDEVRITATLIIKQQLINFLI